MLSSSPLRNFPSGSCADCQRAEVRKAGVEGLPVVTAGREELAPVRSGPERPKQVFELRENGFHLRLQRLPGEVQGNALLPVEGAEPEFVRGAGPDFGNEQQGCKFVRQAPHCLECSRCLLQRQNEFALQFLTLAGRELMAEVRQPVQPLPGLIQLDCAVLGRHPRQRVPRAGGCRGAEQFTEGRLRVQRLEPDLADAIAQVIGEKTHAVGAGHKLL